MPPVLGIAGFNAAWNDARLGDSQQGETVSYQELRKAFEALQTGRATISRDDAQAVAAKFVDHPYLSNAAKREAYAFLDWVGRGKPIDDATREAIKAEFSLRAVAPTANQPLDVPGAPLASEQDLMPATVRTEVENLSFCGGRFAKATVLKANLAGKQVFIVHHQNLSGSADVEHVQLFSLDGTRLARGAVWSRAAPFMWNRRSDGSSPVAPR